LRHSPFPYPDPEALFGQKALSPYSHFARCRFDRLSWGLFLNEQLPETGLPKKHIHRTTRHPLWGAAVSGNPGKPSSGLIYLFQQGPCIRTMSKQAAVVIPKNVAAAGSSSRIRSFFIIVGEISPPFGQHI
jgi:hypothetical protein